MKTALSTYLLVLVMLALLRFGAACSDSESPKDEGAPANAAVPANAPSGDAASDTEGDDGLKPPVEGETEDDAPPSIPPDRLAIGRAAYGTARCALCHGVNANGGGGGPDLTDDVWYHTDGSVEAIERVLRKGVARGEMKHAAYSMPMLPATRYLSDDQIHALAQYIWSLNHD